MGHSMGGGVALELAVHHPDRVDAVVAVSASVRPDGLHPDLGDPSTYATSTIMPTADDFAACGRSTSACGRTPSGSTPSW